MPNLPLLGCGEQIFLSENYQVVVVVVDSDYLRKVGNTLLVFSSS